MYLMHNSTVKYCVFPPYCIILACPIMSTLDMQLIVVNFEKLTNTIVTLCHETQSRTMSTPLWALAMHSYKVIITVATKCPQPIDDNQP